MPYFKNDNDHPIRVDDGSGNLRRIAPGSIVDATGQFADNLKDTGGVSQASKEDREKWVEGRRVSTERTDEQKRNARIGEARVEARSLAVAVPLTRVVGDDAAPDGPPSGTITSAATVAAKGRDEKQAFAPGEADPADADNEQLPPVHRQQAENARDVAEKAAEVYPDAEPPAKAGADKSAAKAEAKPAAKS